MPPGSQRSQSSPHFAATPAVSGKKCVFNFDYDFKIIVFLRDDTFLEGEFARKVKRNFSKWHCSEKCFFQKISRNIQLLRKNISDFSSVARLIAREKMFTT